MENKTAGIEKKGKSRVKLSIDQKIFFCSNLSYCLRSGLTLSRALSIFSSFQKIKKNMKILLQSLLVDLDRGKGFSEALSSHPRAFNDSLISLVASSEETGSLQRALELIAKDLEREKKLTSDIKQALTYPSVVIFAMVGVAFLMVAMVFPQLAVMYDRMQMDLPFYTRAILGTSVFLHKNLVAVVSGVAIFTVANIFLVVSVPFIRILFKKLMSSVPIISAIITNYDLSRFCRSSSLLYENGVPILKAIDLSTTTFFKPQYRRALKIVSAEIEKGASIRNAFVAQKVFPSIFVELVGIGEESASLGEAFGNLSRYYDNKVSESIERFASLLEPLLMVFLGVLVGGMIFSIVTPIYQMVGGLV